MIAWLEHGSTTEDTGARLDRAYRSKAQRFLERGSTGVIGAVLNDLLFGQGSTTKDTGARLYSACRRRA